MENVVIETDRLFLRKIVKEDAGFILEILNTPEWIKNIGDRNVHTMEETETYIQLRFTQNYEVHGFSFYMVIAKDSLESIGICGLIKRTGLAEIDMGYAFLSRYTGKGYALESARACTLYAKNNLGIKKLWGITNEDNDKSIKVLLKLGFQYLKLFHLPPDNIPVNLYELELNGFPKGDINFRLDIELLIHRFYEKVKSNALLGPVFNETIKDTWEVHIPILVDFWEQLLFEKGNYKGNPMKIHLELNQKIPLNMDMFSQWIQLFHSTVDELFNGSNADKIKERALSISTMMQFKISNI